MARVSGPDLLADSADSVAADCEVVRVKTG